MSILCKVADSASWSSLAFALAVSVAIGGVLIYINHKRLFVWTKESIEQTRQVLGLGRRQLDFGHEKLQYSRLRDGEVDHGQTNKVKNASSGPWNAANHQQPFTSIVASDGQRVQLNPARTLQSPRAGLAESEDSPSSSIAEADRDRHFQSITDLSDNSMTTHASDINEPTNKHKDVRNAKNGKDKGKHDMKQKQAAERSHEHKGSQRQEKDGRHGTSGLASIDTHGLSKFRLAGYRPGDDDVCGIGSEDHFPSDADTQTQGMFQELSELGHGPSTKIAEAHVKPEVVDTPSQVALWRLAANRCPVTEAMMEMILRGAAEREQ